MPVYHASMLFNWGTSHGWQETLYCFAADISVAAAAAQRLSLFRVRLLGGGVTLIALRLGDEAIRGDVLLQVPAFAMAAPFAPGADVAWSGLLLRLHTSSRHGFYVLSGFPKPWLLTPPGQPPRIDPALLENLRLWEQRLLADNWRVRVASDVERVVPVVSLQDLGGGLALLTTSEAHGFTLLDETGQPTVLGVHGITYIPEGYTTARQWDTTSWTLPRWNVNGWHQPVAITDNTIAITANLPAGRFTYLPGGTVRPHRWIYPRVDRVLIEEPCPGPSHGPWLPLSWEITSDPANYLDPCGTVMDFGHREKISQLSLYSDSQAMVPAFWYSAPGGALFFPGRHHFANADWLRGDHRLGVGDYNIQDSRPMLDNAPNAYRGLHFCGPLGYYQQGVRLADSPPVLVRHNNLTDCCVP